MLLKKKNRHLKTGGWGGGEHIVSPLTVCTSRTSRIMVSVHYVLKRLVLESYFIHRYKHKIQVKFEFG